jgi:hypothetical protein
MHKQNGAQRRGYTTKMRKILIALLIVIILAGFWLWRGQYLTSLADRFRTIEAASRTIDSITYNGSGTGGNLDIGGLSLNLDETQLPEGRPNVGTTKNGELALSFAGKVFPFGRVPVETEQLRAIRPEGDIATLSVSHSELPWPNFFEVNFMTGNSPKWKRHIYQRLTWKKSTGAKLEMVWQYEQYFYQGTGWTDALMTRPGSTGLIRVEISDGSR